MAQKKPANKRGKKSNSNASKSIVIVVMLAVVVVLIIAVIFVWKATQVQKININPDDEPNQQIGDINIDIPSDDPVVSEVLDNYTTIACFGVDARNKNLAKATRTDAIIIAAIDNNTGDVRLASVYRDTLLNTNTKDKPQYDKCNSAYAYGGPERAINMLNNCLDLYIEDFVTVGFEGVMNTVDAVGGVDIDIQQNEIKFLNDYQASMYSTETNTVITDDYVPVTEVGMQTLSGYQALAYCRIRYTAGNDFKRTERQRDVVSQIVEKAKKLDPQQITKICNDVFPFIATSLDLTEDIIPLATDVGKYTIVGSTGFPFDDKITTGLLGPKGDCVIPLQYTENVKELHEFLYPTVTNYTPSENVQEVGNSIKEITAPYGIGQ